MSGNETILVTGFPSNFLARYVVPELAIARPQARFVFIVRTQDQSEAERRIRDHGLSQRCEILEGDVTSIDFGLSGVEYKTLMSSVDELQHLAHVSYLNASHHLARTVNLGGTREVIEFARASSKLTHIVHWSTALISGTRSGRIKEADFQKPEAFRTYVEQTRFEAERLLREANLTVKLTVMRPSQIVGHSRTGDFERIDGLYVMARMLTDSNLDIPLPLPRLGDRPLHVVPVDFVARLGATLSARPQLRGQTFHLVDRHPMIARDVFMQMAEHAGRPRPRVILPRGLLSRVLSAPGLGRYLNVPKAFLGYISVDVDYDDRNVLVQGLDVSCPHLTSYLPLIVKSAMRSPVAAQSTASA